MNKFTKTSLITAGALAAAGCLLCLISGLLGGRKLFVSARNDEYMLINAVGEALEDAGLHSLGGVLRRAGGSGIEILEEGPDSAESAGHTEWHDEEHGWSNSNPRSLKVNNADADGRIYETHLDAREFENLYLTLGAGTFTVREKDEADDTVDICVQGVGECDLYVKGKTLYVEGFKGIRVLGSIIQDNCITLKFPKGMHFEDIELEVGAGSMDMSDVEAREISAAVGAGELIMERIQARELSAEIGAGSFAAGETFAYDADLEVSVGSCIYQGEISNELDAECSLGSIEMTLEGREDDHNYEIECSAGELEINGSLFSGLAVEKKINNGASSDFELSCDMGSIAVHFDK